MNYILKLSVLYTKDSQLGSHSEIKLQVVPYFKKIRSGKNSLLREIGSKLSLLREMDSTLSLLREIDSILSLLPEIDSKMQIAEELDSTFN